MTSKKYEQDIRGLFMDADVLTQFKAIFREDFKNAYILKTKEDYDRFAELVTAAYASLSARTNVTMPKAKDEYLLDKAPRGDVYPIRCSELMRVTCGGGTRLSEVELVTYYKAGTEANKPFLRRYANVEFWFPDGKIRDRFSTEKEDIVQSDIQDQETYDETEEE